MLNLSAAFDTVHHQTLLHRLRNRFGMQGAAWQWLILYLAERKQFESIGSERSTSRPLTCGVPLVPWTTTVYNVHSAAWGHNASSWSLLPPICWRHTNVLFVKLLMLVAMMKPNSSWRLASIVQLNDNKTKILVFHAKHRPAPSLDCLQVASNAIITHAHVSRDAWS